MRSPSILFISGFLLLTACQSAHAPTENGKQESQPMQQEELSAEQTAEQIVHLLKEKDSDAIAQYVHPEEGVRLSPFTNVQESHVVLQSEDLVHSSSEYTWGNFDGSGEPIELTVSAYFDRFVWDHDYAEAPTIVWDDPKQRGNAINNAEEFYGESARIVEYHFAGFDPQYEGMDWTSLRLVLKQYEGAWKLVGIIHDQWTI